MLLSIPSLIPPDQLAALRHAWEPGGDTGASARAARQLLALLQAHPTFQASTFPTAMTVPKIQRYEAGTGHVDQVDPAFAGESPRLRCDIAAIMALAHPHSYEGGDLVLDGQGVPVRWRGHAGDCLLFDADQSHRIEPVTSGAQVVATTWIQSQVPDARKRRILFDLVNILEDVETDATPSSPMERLRRGYFNLLRLWT